METLKSQGFRLLSCKFGRIIDANQDYYSQKNYQSHVKKKEKTFHDKNIKGIYALQVRST